MILRRGGRDAERGALRNKHIPCACHCACPRGTLTLTFQPLPNTSPSLVLQVERWWGVDPSLLPQTTCEGFCYEFCQGCPLYVIVPFGPAIMMMTLLFGIWCAPCFGREAVNRMNSGYLLLGEGELYMLRDGYDDGCPACCPGCCKTVMETQLLTEQYWRVLDVDINGRGVALCKGCSRGLNAQEIKIMVENSTPKGRRIRPRARFNLIGAAKGQGERIREAILAKREQFASAMMGAVGAGAMQVNPLGAAATMASGAPQVNGMFRGCAAEVGVAPSPAERSQQLQALHAQGILSRAEYEAAAAL